MLEVRNVVLTIKNFILKPNVAGLIVAGDGTKIAAY